MLIHLRPDNVASCRVCASPLGCLAVVLDGSSRIRYGISGRDQQSSSVAAHQFSHSAAKQLRLSSVAAMLPILLAINVRYAHELADPSCENRVCCMPLSRTDPASCVMRVIWRRQADRTCRLALHWKLVSELRREATLVACSALPDLLCSMAILASSFEGPRRCSSSLVDHRCMSCICVASQLGERLSVRRPLWGLTCPVGMSMALLFWGSGRCAGSAHRHEALKKLAKDNGGDINDLEIDPKADAFAEFAARLFALAHTPTCARPNLPQPSASTLCRSRPQPPPPLHGRRASSRFSFDALAYAALGSLALNESVLELECVGAGVIGTPIHVQ